jgi:hypothetical protein
MAIENSEFRLPSSLIFTPRSNTGDAPGPSTLKIGESGSEAASAPAAAVPVTLILRDAPYERHDKQLLDQVPSLIPIGTPEFPAMALGEEIAISDRYRRVKLTASAGGKDQSIAAFKAFDDGILIQKSLYLFNVIVALEWLPSPTTIQQLMSAFRSASDFLYDCTNGYMAFGQVIFTNRELIDKADIQIMASNRFHPRSLVNALNEPDKFSPIRLGRGLWSKNNSVLIPWSEPIAYRTIIHEWGHYALSLHDEYIDEDLLVKRGTTKNCLVEKKPPIGKTNPRRPIADKTKGENVLVVPTYSVSLESIMATLDSSEIVPKQRKTVANDPVRAHLLNKFESLYPGVSPALTGPANAGPNRLPLPLPQFYSTFEPKHNSNQERLLDVNGLEILGQLPQHCWLYLLHRNRSPYVLDQIVAQGAIDDRARDNKSFNEGIINGLGFELFGDTKCDEVLAIGYAQVNDIGDSALFIRRASLGGTTPDWQPNAIPLELPIVTVIPSDQEDLPWPKVVVKVRVVGVPPTCAWIIPPGQAVPQKLNPAQTKPDWESEFVELQQLDGLVVLQYGEGEGAALWVCEYSHGGNPPTSIRKVPAPISAGSSDGNLMLFSRTEDEPTIFASKRVVTTRNYATFGESEAHQSPVFYQFTPDSQVYRLSSGKLPGKPASYLFSVASNSDLPIAPLHPTIIMYFDINSLEDEGEPIIHRYNIQDCIWEPLPTYSPRGSFYAAIPLDKQSSPALVAPVSAESRVEYYQLFLVKSGDSKS